MGDGGPHVRVGDGGGLVAPTTGPEIISTVIAVVLTIVQLDVRRNSIGRRAGDGAACSVDDADVPQLSLRMRTPNVRAANDGRARG